MQPIVNPTQRPAPLLYGVRSVVHEVAFAVDVFEDLVAEFTWEGEEACGLFDRRRV